MAQKTWTPAQQIRLDDLIDASDYLATAMSDLGAMAKLLVKHTGFRPSMDVLAVVASDLHTIHLGITRARKSMEEARIEAGTPNGVKAHAEDIQALAVKYAATGKVV